MQNDPVKLRKLAAWYRAYAEHAGNPVIWEARLRLAEDLEESAEVLEGAKGSSATRDPHSPARLAKKPFRGNVAKQTFDYS
jgi:hypothetical protein